MASLVLTEILEQTKILPDNLQYQVLAYIRTLKANTQKGTSGKSLLKFAGSIPAEDVEIMRETIEMGCKLVELDEK